MKIIYSKMKFLNVLLIIKILIYQCAIKKNIKHLSDLNLFFNNFNVLMFLIIFLNMNFHFSKDKFNKH